MKVLTSFIQGYNVSIIELLVPIIGTSMVFTVSCAMSKDQITELSSVLLTAIAGIVGVFTGAKLNKK